VRTEDSEVRLLTRATGILDERGERAFRIVRRGRGGSEHAPVGIEHQHHVRADALCVVACRREDRRSVSARDGLAKAEIGGEDADAIRQLAGAKADQVLGERSSRAQLLRRARLDGAARTEQHCGKRHSLGDDHQPDDQHEKPVAETAHECRSNRRPS
jgi:hypothetical protein